MRAEGLLGAVLSGNALVRNARSLMAEQPSVLEEMSGGHPDGSRADGHRGRRGGRPRRAAGLRVRGGLAGRRHANLVAALDPEVVVIGGGVSAAGDQLLDPARAALRRTLVGAAHRGVPDLVPPSSGRRPA